MVQAILVLCWCVSVTAWSQIPLGQRRVARRCALNSMEPRCSHATGVLPIEDNVFEEPISFPEDTEDEDDESDIEEVLAYPKGTDDDFFVVEQFAVPSSIDLQSISGIDADDIMRLGLQSDNSTLPVALMALNPARYPSLSRARKACRQGTIVLFAKPENGNEIQCRRGRVGDRVYPDDIIGRQERIKVYASNSFEKPVFELPVIYEDEHFAIVNKPAGVLIYGDKGTGRNTLRAALPHVLQPPLNATGEALLRPICVHRLDRLTSGLVVVGKTKPSLVHLAGQFEDRLVQKTYTAMVSGIPECETILTSIEAYELGIDLDPELPCDWHLAQSEFDGKSALTIWRILGTFPSLDGKDGHLTMVELMPKTGRYHQLRRHMAWTYGTPIVGDPIYGDESMSNKRWHRGLMLCSNRLTISHPYFNTPAGKIEWERLGDMQKYQGPVQVNRDGKVVVSVAINIPNKFEKFLMLQGERAKYAD